MQYVSIFSFPFHVSFRAFCFVLLLRWSCYVAQANLKLLIFLKFLSASIIQFYASASSCLLQYSFYCAKYILSEQGHITPLDNRPFIVLILILLLETVLWGQLSSFLTVFKPFQSPCWRFSFLKIYLLYAYEYTL